MTDLIETPVGRLEVFPASLANATEVIGILTDAANFLIEIGYPAWKPEALPAVMLPAIERGEVFLARLNGEPAATFIIQWTDEPFWGKTPDDAGYLHKFAVARAMAGKEIGQYLVSWVEARVKAEGRPYLRLDCHRTNPVINRYYQNTGFEYCGSLFVNGFDANLYQKRLL